MIYLDHAATTPLTPEVLEAMLPFLSDHYGNPSAPYGFGRGVREAVDAARGLVADLIGAKPSEILFTSGGTESDNLAIKGYAFANRHLGDHIITSTVEHHAVLDPCRQLERDHGFRVTYLPVDEYGRVDPSSVQAALTDKTILVSIMAANNEIGTLQPIQAISNLLRSHSTPGRKIAFHTDAVQLAGTAAINVKAMGVDLLTLSAHKIHGPKGSGVLYARRGLNLGAVNAGGGQEGGRRGGTENVAGIIGLAKALERSVDRLPVVQPHLRKLRDRLLQEIPKRVPGAFITGHPAERVANHASFYFEGVQAEAVVFNLDVCGISCSSRSACTTGDIEPSHVLLALGLPTNLAHGGIRLTVGESNTGEQIEQVLDVLPDVVASVRALATGSRP